MNPVVSRDLLAALPVGGVASAPPSETFELGVFALALDAALGEASVPVVSASPSSAWPAGISTDAPRVSDVAELTPPESSHVLAVGADETPAEDRPSTDAAAGVAGDPEPKTGERRQPVVDTGLVARAATAIVPQVAGAPELLPEQRPEPPPSGEAARRVGAPVSAEAELRSSATAHDASSWAPPASDHRAATRYELRVDGAADAAVAPHDAEPAPVDANPPPDGQLEPVHDATAAERTAETPAVPAAARDTQHARPADAGSVEPDVPADGVAPSPRPGELLTKAELNRLDGSPARLDLEVDTSALGRVRVEAAEHGATLSIQIHTDRPEARALIEQHLDGLHADLASGRGDGSGSGETPARDDTLPAGDGRRGNGNPGPHMAERASPSALRTPNSQAPRGVDVYA